VGSRSAASSFRSRTRLRRNSASASRSWPMVIAASSWHPDSLKAALHEGVVVQRVNFDGSYTLHVAQPASQRLVRQRVWDPCSVWSDFLRNRLLDTLLKLLKLAAVETSELVSFKNRVELLAHRRQDFLDVPAILGRESLMRAQASGNGGPIESAACSQDSVSEATAGISGLPSVAFTAHSVPAPNSIAIGLS
jgi:hypothetical protein